MSPARPTTKAPAPPTEKAAAAEVEAVEALPGFLSDEDRALLLGGLEAAEKREELPAQSMDVMSRVTRRLMRARDHIEGCPGEERPDDVRVEAYSQAIPATYRHDGPLGPAGGSCTVARCLECAGMRLMPGTPFENIRSVVDAAPNAAALGGTTEE